MNIFEKVKLLDLPPDQYVVVGGGVLAAHGIRDTKDIDIVVTSQLFENLKGQGGWREGKKPNGGPALYNDVFEIYLDVNCDSYQPKINELLDRADVINEVPFISLNDLLKLKRGYGRPKDQSDIKLIEEILAK